MTKFKKFISELNKFLLPYDLNISTSSIFEETLLKMAGIEARPYHCEFGLVDPIFIDPKQEGERGFISFQGLVKDNADRFFAFLKEICKDATIRVDTGVIKSADKEYVITGHAIPTHQLPPATYYFSLDMRKMFTFVLPAFKEAFPRLVETSPSSLDKYRQTTPLMDPFDYGYTLLGDYFKHLVLNENARHIIILEISKDSIRLHERHSPAYSISYGTFDIAYHPTEGTFCEINHLTSMPPCDFPKLDFIRMEAEGLKLLNSTKFIEQMIHCLSSTLAKNTYPHKAKLIQGRIDEFRVHLAAVVDKEKSSGTLNSNTFFTAKESATSLVKAKDVKSVVTDKLRDRKRPRMTYTDHGVTFTPREEDNEEFSYTNGL